MALRYQLPADMASFRPVEKCVVVPATLPAEDVAFRGGSDMAKLAASLLGKVSVKLDASMGAGKSTLFPSAMAKATGGLVVHVTPNPFLAKELWQYVGSLKVKDPKGFPELSRYSSLAEDFPQSGVVYVGSALFVARWLKAGGLPKAKDVTVFLDEAHESDCYTDLVRNLSVPMGATRLIQASATFGAGQPRRVETQGKVEPVVFKDREPVTEWDLDTLSKPWGVPTFDGNVIVYEDSRSGAAALVRGYLNMGCMAFRMSRYMSEASYDEAMRCLRTSAKHRQIVVFIADHSFRSGFTYPEINRAIDLCKISRVSLEQGEPRVVNRLITRNESLQAMNRLGRVAGHKAKYYRKDERLPEIIYDLEDAEVDAAAYLYRLLGYIPRAALAGAVMAKHNLPATCSFVAAFNDQKPLAYLVLDKNGAVRPFAQCKSDGAGVLATSPPSYSDAVAGADNVDKAKGAFTASAGTGSSSRAKTVSSASGSDGTDDKIAGMIRRVTGMAKEVKSVEMVYGKTYSLSTVSGEYRDEGCFPGGFSSLVKYMRSLAEGREMELTYRQAAAAANLALAEYNVVVSKIVGMDKALDDLVKLRRPDNQFTLRAWIEDVCDQIAALKRRADGARGIVEQVCVGKYSLVESGPIDSVSREEYKFLMASYGKIVLAEDRVGKCPGYDNAVGWHQDLGSFSKLGITDVRSNQDLEVGSFKSSIKFSWSHGFYREKYTPLADNEEYVEGRVVSMDLADVPMGAFRNRPLRGTSRRLEEIGASPRSSMDSISSISSMESVRSIRKDKDTVLIRSAS